MRKLEHKYGDELAVIGIHSAKFTSERDTENIRKAVLRYELEHPVINDAEFAVWQQYSCRAWPTIVFLDPEARIIGRRGGGGGGVTFEQFDPIIRQMVQEFDAQGLIDRALLPRQDSGRRGLGDAVRF